MRWYATLVLPADSPKMVTMPGSPPKLATLSLTQARARAWSLRPVLPGT